MNIPESQQEGNSQLEVIRQECKNLQAKDRTTGKWISCSNAICTKSCMYIFSESRLQQMNTPSMMGLVLKQVPSSAHYN